MELRIEQEIREWELIYLKLKKMILLKIKEKPQDTEKWNEELDKLDVSFERIKKSIKKL